MKTNTTNFHTNDKNKEIYLPHYTEPIFRKPQVVYGVDEKGLEWVYSDRLKTWDRGRFEVSKYAADKLGKTEGSAGYYEAFLSLYFEKDINLVCVKAGTDGRGWPYRIYGYKDQGRQP